MNWNGNTISHSRHQEKLSEFQNIIQSLEAEKDSLEKMVYEQRDFIAKMVHEARCHVRGILLGFNILYQMKNSSEKVDEFERLLYSLKESTLKYKNLLYNLTDYSFNQYGKNIQVKMETVSVNNYLRSVFEDFTDYLPESGYELQVQYADPAFNIVIDTMKFRQVVHNLVINATQHGEKGIIAIIISADASTNEWKLLINNPYNQKETNYTENGNLGLGLAISRQLIMLMKGTVKIQPAQQFTVTVCMPTVAF